MGRRKKHLLRIESEGHDDDDVTLESWREDDKLFSLAFWFLLFGFNLTFSFYTRVFSLTLGHEQKTSFTTVRPAVLAATRF